MITKVRKKMAEWISVKDRLPDKLEAVNIVWVNHNPVSYYEHIKDKPFTATAYYYGGKWWWYSTVCEDCLIKYDKCECDEMGKDIEVTHWMPLPEPPQESEE
jgi:hypothetical protein